MFDMKVFKSSPEKIIKIHLRYFFNEHLSSAAYIFLYSKNWKSWKKCQLGATLPPSHVKHKKNMWKRKVVLVPLGYILTGPGVKNWFWELSKIGQCLPAQTLCISSSEGQAKKLLHDVHTDAHIYPFNVDRSRRYDL